MVHNFLTQLIRHIFPAILLGVLVILPGNIAFAQTADPVETGAVDYQWSNPVPIPLKLGNQIPVSPRAVVRNNTLFLAFQVHAPNDKGIYLPQEIYAMRYRNGSWNTPFNVTKSRVASTYPRLALTGTGPATTLHLIWGEQTTPESQLDGPPRPIVPDEIFYATRKNGVWSEPYSLFQTNRRAIQFTQRLVSDGQGALHFVFSAPDPVNRKPRIYYIRKPGDIWTAPEPIATGYEPELIRLDGGRLLLAYIRADSAWARRNRSRDVNSVFIKASADGGRTWSKDLIIQRSGNKPAYSPQFAVDGKGSVHLFWRQNVTGDRRPDTIMHTYSADGKHWTPPKGLIDAETQKAGYPHYFVMTGTPDGSVHAVFRLIKGLGARTSKLFYTRWDGTEWQEPQQLFDFETTGLADLVYDADTGQLHLLFTAGSGGSQKLYHSTYQE